MGAMGAIIMGFFGATFASLTLWLQWHRTGPILAVPFVGFAAIAIATWSIVRLPGPGFVRPPGSGKVMMWSSIGEGIGLFVINNLAINLGHADLVIPAMALVVGLHFLPIAYWSPFRPLYILAAVIITGAVVGVLIAQPTGGAVAGFTAAVALAGAALAAMRREIRAKRVGRTDA
jgi:hypothetical protein